MAEAKENRIRRLVLAIAAGLVALSVIGNMIFVWRNVALQRELVAAQVRVQELNQKQQLIPAIAQDLVNLAPQHPWLVPILQRYGLVAQAPASPSSKPQTPPK